MATRRAASAPLPFEGRTLGGFRIASPIATGGMATVFLGRKTGPGRYAQMAAIKVIHPHLAQNRELTEMFMDEARLASCVNHPNVCRVLDFGEAEGTFFLAMEYVRGENFAEVLKRFALEPEARARLAVLSAHVLGQACEGLHAIHEAVDGEGRPLSIVHRDVSPQNLLVAYDGSVRLLDFGIASAEGRAHTGSADVVRGRYAYMAPEQMRGLDLDRRADLWSLGVMLREAVTGHNPYLRDTQIATMLAVTQEAAPSWPAGSEPRLRAIAELAAAREPEARFATARELGNALMRYLSERGESALSTELSQHMRKVFAQEIAEKRATLRALAEDDTYTDTYSSGYPAVQISAQPSAATSTVRPPQRARAKSRRWPRRTLQLGLCGLFVVSLGIAWFATRSQLAARPPEASAPATPSRQRARVAPREPATVVTSPSPSPEAAPVPTALSQVAEAAPVGGAPDRRDRVEIAPPAHKPRAAPPHRPPPSNELLGAGTVVIGTSQGWAKIYDKGKKLGSTPLRVELNAGNHTLVIRPYGEGAARRISVDVRPGETIKLRVEL